VAVVHRPRPPPNRGNRRAAPRARSCEAGAEKGTAVEEDSLDNFFAAVPPEDKAKFQALRRVLEGQLSGIKVYRVGDEPEKDVYIVGKTADGRWAGLKTTVVET
jgi:hypothetical protein